MNYGEYRQPTAYNGLYKYVAPEGFFWKSEGTIFGKIIYGEYQLRNNYELVKEE